jgi:hypothetical protein
VLRANGDFRRLFGAVSLSLVGDWFTFVALSGFVYGRTGSAGWTALLFAVESLPGVVLMPLIGSLTDRWDRRRLRIGCDLASLLPLAGLLAAFRTGGVPLALGCLAALSACAAVAGPIPETALPNLVTGGQLPYAQTLLGGVYASGLLIGAGLGGVLTAAWGTSATLAVDGASFLLSAWLVSRVRGRFSEEGAATGARRLRITGDVAELWRFVRRTPVVARLLWLTAGLRLCYGMVGLLPVYALARFHVGAGGVGAMYLAQGAGAVLGPFLARRLAGGSPVRLRYAAGGALAVFGLGYLALAQATGLAVGMAAAVLGHLGVGACAVLALNGLQAAAPDRIRGRVMVLAFSLSSALQGVSSLAVAPAAATIGPVGATRILACAAIVFSAVWLIRARARY